MIAPRAVPDPATGPIPSPGAARRWSDLLPRALSAVVMIALALGTARAGGMPFAIFWLAAAVAVHWEWQRLIGPADGALRFGVGAAALAVAAVLVVHGDGLAALALLGLGVLLLAALAAPGLRVMAATGLAYAGALALAVIALRLSGAGGLEAILWLFAVVWGTDISAYFGGRLIGGPKLWPRLSPAKTWSGFLCGIGVGALLGLAVSPAGSSHAAVLLVGLIAGALAQGGDLFESWLKRRYGVKDASHLIPGHGGVMDRLDGFIVAAVFAACLGTARAGMAHAGCCLFT